jgi:hypothetical protein
MTSSAIRFQPRFEFSEVYDTGLAGISVRDTGDLASASSFGSRLSWGVSGSKGWKRTLVGLRYSGSSTIYARGTQTTGLNQSFSLGLTQRITRHTTLTLRQSAGLFTRTFGTAGLAAAVPFDPSQSYIPTTDFFDNRTLYMTTQADYTIQKTARLSFNLGGDFYANGRRSQALSDSSGETARGDVQYRVSKRSTVGVLYRYSHFTFSRAEKGTDAHSFAGSYAMRISRHVEFSGYAGVSRVESKFIEKMAVDPSIAQLLGITATQQIVHTLGYRPFFAGRLSRAFETGVVYVHGGEAMTPGNGLFLTSYERTLSAGYGYTGLRRWSASLNAALSRSQAVGLIAGDYNSYTGTASVARTLGHGFNIHGQFSARRYGSPTYSNYNRLIYNASVGVGFSPGDLPVRLW